MSMDEDDARAESIEERRRRKIDRSDPQTHEDWMDEDDEDNG